MIDRAKDVQNSLGFDADPLPDPLYAPLEGKHDPTPYVLVGFAFFIIILFSAPLGVNLRSVLRMETSSEQRVTGPITVEGNS